MMGWCQDQKAHQPGSDSFKRLCLSTDRGRIYFILMLTFHLCLEVGTSTPALEWGKGDTLIRCNMWGCTKTNSVTGLPRGQWWGICLAIQETWAQFLVQEDPTCCGAAMPVCHNYWARERQQEKPLQSEVHMATRDYPLALPLSK